MATGRNIAELRQILRLQFVSLRFGDKFSYSIKYNTTKHTGSTTK